MPDEFNLDKISMKTVPWQDTGYTLSWTKVVGTKVYNALQPGDFTDLSVRGDRARPCRTCVVRWRARVFWKAWNIRWFATFGLVSSKFVWTFGRRGPFPSLILTQQMERWKIGHLLFDTKWTCVLMTTGLTSINKDGAIEEKWSRKRTYITINTLWRGILWILKACHEGPKEY